MSIRRSTAALSIAAGLFGGLTGLTVANVFGPAATPIAVQPASSDDGPGDISGPCDEAEHADDPRCAGLVSSPSSTSSTSTSSTTPSGAVAESTHTLDAAGAGTVTYSVSGMTLTLVDATPNAGWTLEVEQAGGLEIDLDFRSGTQRVQVDVEFEDGAVRERVRFRDDADDSETRIENGVVVRTESADDDADDDDADNSGPGSLDDDDSDDDDEDNSDSGSHDDDDDDDDDDADDDGDNSGSGSHDDD